MKQIWQYIRGYQKELDQRVFIGTVLFTGTLIYFNYAFHLEQHLIQWQYLPFPGLTGHVILYAAAFSVPYFLYSIFQTRNYFKDPKFTGLLLLAALVFACKVTNHFTTDFFPPGINGDYWNQVIYWPIRLIFIAVVLFIIKRKGSGDFYGLSIKQFSPHPYLQMLLLMVPLIIFASTQADFLAMYPKLNHAISQIPFEKHQWAGKILFELSYGSDFFSIELFFRGFLIMAFTRFAGKHAILPMACFYCTIHFGKPLFECISSFWGGLLLGIVSYNTRSITGGLMVHLGIAWMMELGGYWGNIFKHIQ
ncbi:MAG: CPBP family intramembrane metalloprotease [Terrimonas sp.]|nr:CPBP family intramembrane metalloprotease [Terrimonas sp.]